MIERIVSLPTWPPKFISVILIGIFVENENLAGRSIFILAIGIVYSKSKETVYLSCTVLSNSIKLVNASPEETGREATFFRHSFSVSFQ